MITLFARECELLKEAHVPCVPSGLDTFYRGDEGVYLGDGYKLTFAKFIVCALAMEAGLQPTFIDSDVSVTAPEDSPPSLSVPWGGMANTTPWQKKDIQTRYSNSFTGR